MPRRLRRSRNTELPLDAVYVGRPTIYGNPFKIGDPHPEHQHERIKAPLCDRAQRRGWRWRCTECR